MQVAYRPNRSTTARNESDHLIILGTSKGFGKINRNRLIEDLRNTIETDELHIISKLLNVSLSTKPTQVDYKETVRVHSTLPTALAKR